MLTIHSLLEAPESDFMISSLIQFPGFSGKFRIKGFRAYRVPETRHVHKYVRAAKPHKPDLLDSFGFAAVLVADVEHA